MTFVFSSYSMLLCNKPYVSKCIILGEESIRVKEVYMILACVLFLNSVMFFISSSFLDRERLVVVRETDGTLRTANGDERDRMDQIYYPRCGVNG